jgi:hypothetical protein
MIMAGSIKLGAMSEPDLRMFVQRRAESVGGQIVLLSLIRGDYRELERVVEALLDCFGSGVAYQFVAGVQEDCTRLGLKDTFSCTFSTCAADPISLQLTCNEGNGTIYEVDVLNYLVTPRQTTATVGGGSNKKSADVAETFERIRRHVIARLGASV